MINYLKSFLLLYVFSMFFFFNFKSFISFWILLEINMILFICLMKIYLSTLNSEEFIPMNSCLYYFMCQSFSSLILIFFFILNKESYYIFFFIFLCLSFKIGIFPFYFWSFYFSDFISNFIFYIFLTIQKIPLMLFLFSTETNMMNLMIIMNLILGFYLLMSSKKFNYIILSSSIYSISWFFILWMCSFYIFIMSYLLYSFHMIFILFKKSKFNMNNLEINFNSFIFLSFISGVPPFSMFFFKYFSVLNILNANSITLFVFMFFISFVISMIYFKKFFLMIFTKNNFYMSFSYKYLMKIYYFLPHLIFFL